MSEIEAEVRTEATPGRPGRTVLSPPLPRGPARLPSHRARRGPFRQVAVGLVTGLLGLAAALANWQHPWR